METSLDIEGRSRDIFNPQHTAYTDQCDPMKQVFFFRRGPILFEAADINMPENGDDFRQQVVYFNRLAVRRPFFEHGTHAADNQGRPFGVGHDLIKNLPE